MGFKKGDQVVLMDNSNLVNMDTELYGIYTVDSYAKSDDSKYDILPILIIEEIAGAFDANRFITFNEYRKQKLNKILSRYGQ